MPLAPYGAYRDPNLYVFDLRFQKSLKFHERYRVSLYFDLFNLFNSNNANVESPVVWRKRARSSTSSGIRSTARRCCTKGFCRRRRFCRHAFSGLARGFHSSNSKVHLAAANNCKLTYTVFYEPRSSLRNWFCEFVKSDSLRKHMLAVEACVAAYARKFGEDEEKWAVTALLHDFDWEIHPNLPDHPTKGESILAERGVSEDIRRAILSHADFTGVPRVSPLEKTLFACDELSGVLTACDYVKPGRSIQEVETKSVRKKLKDKAFARAVNRDDIVNGATEMGVDLDQHIEFCIQAMQARAAELGLAGTAATTA